MARKLERSLLPWLALAAACSGAAEPGAAAGNDVAPTPVAGASPVSPTPTAGAPGDPATAGVGTSPAGAGAAGAPAAGADAVSAPGAPEPAGQPASGGSPAPPADAGVSSDVDSGSGESTLSTSCDDADAFDARVFLDGATWVAERGASGVYSGSDMMDAMQAALDSLTPGRTSKESVIVCGSGRVGPHDYASTGDLKAVDVPSYSVLDVRGTITVADEGEGVIAPVRCLGQDHIEIPNLRIEGNPRYSVWIQSCSDVHLGHIEVSLSNVLTIGHGIRIDDNRGPLSRDIRLDHAVVETTGTHGVETYGVDGLRIGRVVARDTAGCGLLLNATSNAEVESVDAVGAGSGTGYAAFRIANAAGPNIHVGEVVARGGGRGVFCVSESGGLVIDRVDIEDTESNGILIENCYGVTIAAEAGRVSGADVRIAARDTFAPSSDVVLQNLTVTGSTIRESPCGGSGNAIVDNVLVDSSLEACPATTVTGNTP